MHMYAEIERNSGDEIIPQAPSLRLRLVIMRTHKAQKALLRHFGGHMGNLAKLAIFDHVA